MRYPFEAPLYGRDGPRCQQRRLLVHENCDRTGRMSAPSVKVESPRKILDYSTLCQLFLTPTLLRTAI